MTTVPPNAKRPTDRKTKTMASPDELWHYTDADAGIDLAFEVPLTSVITPGFIRRNRDNEADIVFGVIEAIADDAQLDVIDNMTFKQFSKFSVALGDEIQAVQGASLGE